MENFIVNIIENYGYLGILVLILVENIFPPIPSEIILALGGFFTVKFSLNYFGVVISATIGSILGAVILYYIGYYINSDRVTGLFRNKNGFLDKNMDNIRKAKNFYLKYENISVFLCRMLPIIRSLISIPAGMFKMNMIKFIFYTGMGSLIWNGIITYLGVYLGENWKFVKHIVNNYSIFIIIVLVILIGVFLLYKRRKNGK